MDSLSVKFERKKLYDEIWEISLTGVSKKYGLNYTKLVQACKKIIFHIHLQAIGLRRIWD